MSDDTTPPADSGTPPPASPPASPPAQDPPPSDPPPPAPAPPRQDGGGFTQLLDAVNALPEKMANAVREAIPPAQPPASPPASTPPADSTPPPAKKEDEVPAPGKSRSFADWWFGR